MTARLRPIVADGSRPSLPRHVRLRHDPVRGAWALLSPEKVLWPDEVSLAILRRCDGRTSVASIAGALAAEYDADETEVRRDVTEFLQDWSDRMVVRL
jgi:pyrroloquinoline quinone biosynthesis protein D